tara:strand:+ start:13 stop:1449 length:1437 start_codon:yes stop_codon:yes gene_type:complete
MNYTDVLIIGSGPGGSISGYEIIKKTNLKVTIFEKGKLKSNKLKPYSSQEMDEAYYKSGLSACVGKGDLIFATAETLGGGSEINSGFFLDLPKKIFDNWKKNIDNLSLTEIKKNLREIKFFLKVNSSKNDEGKASLILKKGCNKLKLDSKRTERWIRSSKKKNTWRHERYGMVNTYLKMFKKLGGTIKTNHDVIRIIDKDIKNNFYTILYSNNGKKKYIKCKYIFVCGGSIMTPEFLLNSGIRKNIGKTLKFHQMSRLVAESNSEINENEFGVPVRQVNHYKPDMTFGCSVSTKQHLALWMSSNKSLKKILRNYKKYSIYYSLINSKTEGKIIKPFKNFGSTIFYKISQDDIEKHKLSIKRLAKILFLGGIKRIFLSSGNKNYKDQLSFKSINEVNNFLMKKKYIPELSSIHLFSSVPMGEKDQYPLDSYGKLKKTNENIYVNDSSMLPSPTGVNPQGIIMALAKRNVENFITKLNKN